MFEDDITATDDTPTRITKEGIVRTWRFDEFRRLGFATASALRLVDSSAELSLARWLVGQGCPLTTASAILE